MGGLSLQCHLSDEGVARVMADVIAVRLLEPLEIVSDTTMSPSDDSRKPLSFPQRPKVP